MAKLSTRHKDQLCAWLGGRKDFTLLYQATRDGCVSQTFHQKCDNKGPTVTVCYNTAGYVFGGYTATTWLSNSAYHQDANAFLFRLHSPNTNQSKKYPVKPGVQNAIYGHASYGPTFGGGHDFYSFSNTVNLTGNFYQGNGYTKVGHTYDMQGDDATAYNGNNMQYTDIEVYQVTDSIDPPIRQTPWRKLPNVEQKVMKSELEKYCPPGKIGHVNILLLGAVGAGKSSFFNTVNSIFQGRLTSVARSGSAEHSLTTTYRVYKVKSAESGQPLKIRLCDTRGLEEGLYLDLSDIMAIVDGHLPDRFTFNPLVPVSPDTPGYKKSPTPDDRIHCIAFVVDSTTIDVFPDKILTTFKAVQNRVNVQGIPQVVLVTKVDKACPVVSEDLSQMFYSTAIGDLVENTGQLFGLPRSHVFPVKNYEEELTLDDNVDVPALSSLVHMTHFADDYLNDCPDVDTD